MMPLMLGRVPWVLLSGAILFGHQIRSPAAWDAADRATVRLSPDRFPQLPGTVRHELRRRRCTIPQASEATEPEGVVTGAFYSINEVDWAVLCSVDRRSSVLVFRGGSTQRVEAVAPARPDTDYLQGGGPDTTDTIVFSRAIRTASAEEVLRRAREKGEPPPDPAPIHDSIEDIFAGKGSTIFYWRAGKWVIVGGAN
jgi:hypothetical protein